MFICFGSTNEKNPNQKNVLLMRSSDLSDHRRDDDSSFLLTERYDLPAFLGFPAPASPSEIQFFLGYSH